jgi:SPP1 family predicted phage head-tail adaptor
MLGTLDQRIALQVNTLAPDGGGGYTESWQTYAVVWAKIVPLGAGDTFGSDRLESRVRHRVMLRRRDDIMAGHRLAVDSRTLKVHAVFNQDVRAQFMTLLCEELP